MLSAHRSEAPQDHGGAFRPVIRSIALPVLLLLAAACSSTQSQASPTPGGQQTVAPPSGSLAPSQGNATPQVTSTPPATTMASGPGTISGTLTVNDEPVADEDVKLIDAIYVEPSPGLPTPTAGASPTEDTRPTAITGPDGTFIFNAVEPGDYAFSVGVTVENAFAGDGFGLEWDKPCSAVGFQSLNVNVSKNGTPFGVIVSVTNQVTSTNADQVTPITVGPGQHVVVDVPLICTITDGG